MPSTQSSIYFLYLDIIITLISYNISERILSNHLRAWYYYLLVYSLDLIVIAGTAMRCD